MQLEQQIEEIKSQYNNSEQEKSNLQLKSKTQDTQISEMRQKLTQAEQT